MEAPPDNNASSSLAPPDDIPHAAGLSMNAPDAQATEGWVLAQLEAFKHQLFGELNVQFGNFLRQASQQGGFPFAMPVPESHAMTLGISDYDKEEVVIPVLKELVKTHKFPSSETVRARIVNAWKKSHMENHGTPPQPADEEKVTNWVNISQRWLSTKMRELRSTDNKTIRKVFCRIYPDKPKDYMNYPPRWDQFKKECSITTPAEEAWAHIVIEVLLNDSTLGKVGELEVYKRFRQRLGDDTTLPAQREKPKTKRARPQGGRSRDQLKKRSHKADDESSDIGSMHEPAPAVSRHDSLAPSKDHM